MTWFKVDDGLSQHRKVMSIPRAHRKAAMGLWVLAGSWCARGLTDGHVPEYMLDELACATEDAKWLVYAGLWEDHPGGDGWVFHEWDERQPTRETVEARREVRAAAGRQGGIKSGKTRRATAEAKSKQVASMDEASASGDASTRSNPRPDPYQNQTLLSGEDADSPPSGGGARKTLDQHFEEFWGYYPRKEGKGDARKAWDKARKRATIANVLAAVIRYSKDPNLPDVQYVPLAQKWLNGDRFADPALPPRARENGTGQPHHRADGTIDPDAVLGRDLWQLPTPPEGIRAGQAGFAAWARAERDAHMAERMEQARLKLEGEPVQ